MVMLQNLAQKIGLFTPKIWQQSVRHRGKFNTHQPKPRHDIGRYLEELTRPVIIRQIPDIAEQCEKQRKYHEKNYKTTTDTASEFERFLGTKYVGKLLNENEAMIICHRHYSSKDLIRRNKIVFKQDDISLWDFNTITMKLFIETNPKYKNLLPIINTGLGRNVYLFVKKEESLKKLLQHLRKMPHLVMFGGLIGDRLYTKNGIMDYTKLDLQTLRGELCGILMQNLSSSTTTLMSPIEALSLTLKQIVDIKTENEENKQN